MAMSLQEEVQNKLLEGYICIRWFKSTLRHCGIKEMQKSFIRKPPKGCMYCITYKWLRETSGRSAYFCRGNASLIVSHAFVTVASHRALSVAEDMSRKNDILKANTGDVYYPSKRLPLYKRAGVGTCRVV